MTIELVKVFRNVLFIVGIKKSNFYNKIVDKKLDIAYSVTRKTNKK